MDTKLVKLAATRKRRRHGAEFKAEVIRACEHPGVSIAAVALANGLNANLVRRWVNAHRDTPTSKHRSSIASARPAQTTVVPVSVQPLAVVAGTDIRLDLRYGTTTIQVAWPVSHALDLGRGLKDLLQ